MKKILFAILMASSIAGFSQKKVVLTEGDLRSLQGQTAINVEFAYDFMTVGAGISEATFVANKKELWDEKEPGKGKMWEEMWFGERQTKYEPTFKFYLGKASGLQTRQQDSPFTLVFKTTHTEPGWTGGVMGGVATISGEAWIVDTSDRSKVMAKILLAKVKGNDYNGGDFETGRRLQQAYMNAAQQLGDFIKSNR